MNCQFCGKELTNKRKFCSRDCSNRSRAIEVEKRFCKHCNKEITRQKILQRQIFCSKICKDLHQTITLEEKNCKICGKSLNRRQLLMKQKTCSIKCGGIATSIRQFGKAMKNINNTGRAGKSPSEEVRKKISIGVSKAKTGLKRKPFTDEWKKKLGLSMLGKHQTEKQKMAVSKANTGNTYCLGRIASAEHKKKMRIAIIEDWKKKDPNAHSNYNPRAIPFFEEIDKILNTKSYYGPNEFQIKELGYFPDYINFENKLIIEYDEEDHFRAEKLRKVDLIRQQEIQNFYPDFHFCRIREKYLH